MNDPALSVAVRAARNAAAVIEDAARDLKRLPAFSKEHADIVAATAAEAESAIGATLSGAFPEHAILGGDGRVKDARNEGATYRWIVGFLRNTHASSMKNALNTVLICRSVKTELARCRM